MRNILLVTSLIFFFAGSAFGQYQAGGGNATGSNSIAIVGTASGNSSISVGDQSLANALESISIGRKSSSTSIRSIAIGYNSSAPSSRSTVIGPDADGTSNPIYTSNGNPIGGARVVIGWGAKGYAWRGVSIGEKAISGHVSTTSVGANSFSGKPHDVALGRGAYNPSQSEIDRLKMPDTVHSVLGGDRANTDIQVYFSNTWANQFDTPPTGIGIASTSVPSNHAVVLHGVDALDARANPTQGATDGGHLQLSGGASTESGAGGRVEFATTPGVETQSNCKNKRVVAGYFDADKTACTRFVLLDNKTGTYRRVGYDKVKLCSGEEKDVLCLEDGPAEGSGDVSCIDVRKGDFMDISSLILALTVFSASFVRFRI